MGLELNDDSSLPLSPNNISFSLNEDEETISFRGGNVTSLGYKPSPGVLLGIGIYLTVVGGMLTEPLGYLSLWEFNMHACLFTCFPVYMFYSLLLPTSLFTLGCFFVSKLGLVATVGNILFIMTVTRWKIMRSNAHMILLLNLAVADLAISFVGYPYTTVAGYYGSWPFGEVVCVMYGFLCYTFAQVSMNIMVAVSIFRYVTVCHPDKQHYLTYRTGWMVVGVCWLYALLWTVPPLLGWSSYTFEPTQVSCSLDWHDQSLSGISYTIGCIFFCYIVHLGILISCYGRIFSRVHNLGFTRKWRERQTELVRRESIASPTRTSVGCEYTAAFSFITDNLSPLEIHILRMNVTMVMTYLICWSPYALLSLSSIFTHDISPFWYIFPTMFAKMSCMMNPIVYGLTNQYLRKELLSVARKCLRLTTPMENLQLMRKQQQEALYNKNGIYTGKVHHSCTCEECTASRRQIFVNHGGKVQRALIDEFVQKQREKEAAEELAAKGRASSREVFYKDLILPKNVNNPDPESGLDNAGPVAAAAVVPGNESSGTFPETRVLDQDESLQELKKTCPGLSDAELSAAKQVEIRSFTPNSDSAQEDQAKVTLGLTAGLESTTPV